MRPAGRGLERGDLLAPREQAEHEIWELAAARREAPRSRAVRRCRSPCWRCIRAPASPGNRRRGRRRARSRRARSAPGSGAWRSSGPLLGRDGSSSIVRGSRSVRTSPLTTSSVSSTSGIERSAPAVPSGSRSHCQRTSSPGGIVCAWEKYVWINSPRWPMHTSARSTPAARQPVEDQLQDRAVADRDERFRQHRRVGAAACVPRPPASTAALIARTRGRGSGVGSPRSQATVCASPARSRSAAPSP